MDPKIYRHSIQRYYAATANGTGYVTTDIIAHCTSASAQANETTVSPIGMWVNFTQETVLASAPPMGDLNDITQGGGGGGAVDNVARANAAAAQADADAAQASADAAQADADTAQSTADSKVAKAGDTMTGQLTLPGGGTGLQADTVQERDEAITIALTSSMSYRGMYDPSSSLYPTTGGRGIGGAPVVGDFWLINGNGTLGTQVVENRDVIIALVDSPGQVDDNWDVSQGNIEYTPENVANKSSDVALTGGPDTYPNSPAAKGYADTVVASRLAISNDLSDLNDVATARTNLGLGTAAQNNTGDFDTAGSAAAAQAFSIQRANHTGTQTASTISDFAATTRGTLLTGLSTSTSQVIAATDSILIALGYLQAQINSDTSVKTPITVSGSRALADTDHDRMLLVTGAFTLTLNTGLRADFRCRVQQTSASQCTFANGTATFRNSVGLGANAKTAAQYSVAYLEPGPSGGDLNINGDITA